MCEIPICYFCGNFESPFLLNEINMMDGRQFRTTQREKDIASIIKFFYINCKQTILNTYKQLTLDNNDSFIWDFGDTISTQVTKNTITFTYYIHNLSSKWYNIDSEFYKAAQKYQVLGQYRNFLTMHRLTHFVPPDLDYEY